MIKYQDCKTILIAVTIKLAAKRTVKCPSPNNMKLHPEESAHKFDKLVDKLFKKKHITLNEADLAKVQHNKLLTTMVK